jgi:acetyltransferase-like isoleucine patch superfamily enzyme
MKEVLTATIKYITNHVIAHIPSHTIRCAWYRHVLGWHIEPDVIILMGQHIQMEGIRKSRKRVTIGKGTVINHSCHLYTVDNLIIGEHASISSEVWLVTGGHDMNDPNFSEIHKPIVIGDYAWIGIRATILAGVTIGKGAVVMAGSVVINDVPPYSVAGGVPARVMSRRKLDAPTYKLNFYHLLE